jgi:hypothetical protein
MSQKICVQSEIRDMLILKDTLNQLGHNFNEISAEVVEIKRSWNPISFNTSTGAVSYDNAHLNEVNQIKQTYMVNFYKNQAIQEGMNVTESVNASGEIELHITH